MRPASYAVITTYNRPDEALGCIKTLGESVETIVVIDNGSEKEMPEPDDSQLLRPWYVIREPMQPVNLSALWNIGLDFCAKDARSLDADRWDVAILNDDLLVPPGWFLAVQTGMRLTGSVAGCSHWGQGDYKIRMPGPVNLYSRMTGWAFMLRGESGIRADENLTWWYGDDDVDWTAREMGGMSSVNFAEPMNLHPNGLMTPGRQVQAGKDREYFVKKWGQAPW